MTDLVVTQYEMVSISQLEYENLIRADEALKIVTELLQAEPGDYADIKSLKIVLGVANKEGAEQ